VYITVQNTIFYQVCFLNIVSFIVNIDRATIVRQRSVINNIDEILCYFLSELVAENGSSFAVKIRLKSVSYRFM